MMANGNGATTMGQHRQRQWERANSGVLGDWDVRETEHGKKTKGGEKTGRHNVSNYIVFAATFSDKHYSEAPSNLSWRAMWQTRAHCHAEIKSKCG